MLQTHEASAIQTEVEMKQASDAMREALKGDSAASAEMSDLVAQAQTSDSAEIPDVEMVQMLQNISVLNCTACMLRGKTHQTWRFCRCHLLLALSCGSNWKTWVSALTSKQYHAVCCRVLQIMFADCKQDVVSHHQAQASIGCMLSLHIELPATVNDADSNNGNVSLLACTAHCSPFAM